MDTNYQRSSDETSSALITRTIVRSSGNRTQSSFVLCSTNAKRGLRPRTRVPDLVQHRGESPWLANEPTVLIATIDRLLVNRSMPVFGIPSPVLGVNLSFHPTRIRSETSNGLDLYPFRILFPR